MSHTYRLGSSKLLSDIELPELAPWADDFPETDIIQFKLGRAETTGSSQSYIIQAPRRVLIEGGVRVTVELANDDDMADVRALLMGPVQAILWHQRGLLPLHASAVSANGSAIAIAGPREQENQRSPRNSLHWAVPRWQTISALLILAMRPSSQVSGDCGSGEARLTNWAFRLPAFLEQCRAPRSLCS